MKLPIKDIAILLGLRAIRWFLVIIPIITLFYKENGITMQEIFWIQSAFALSVVIFDIPTGYFADVIGRKTSIILGLLISIFGFSIYILSS
jgi:MFS family permease